MVFHEDATFNFFRNGIGDFFDIDGFDLFASFFAQAFPEFACFIEDGGVFFGGVFDLAVPAFVFAFDCSLSLGRLFILDLPVQPAKEFVGEERDCSRIVA